MSRITKQGLKLTDIKGKPYVEVNERIRYFREYFKGFSLVSNLVSLEGGVCVFEAQVKDTEGTVIANGFAYEKEGSTFINKTSYIENCETSAWGRALANFGIGVDTSIASAEEVETAINNQEGYKTVSKSTADEKLKYKKEFINICAANGIDMGNITDFFNFCDPTINEDEKLKGNTIVQFLRSGDYFMEQVEAYLGWKSKQQ